MLIKEIGVPNPRKNEWTIVLLWSGKLANEQVFNNMFCDVYV